MNRVEGWEQRLNAIFEAAPKVSFAWGIRDCMLWPCDAIQALIAYDPGAAWRGTYSDEIGAWRAVRAIVGSDAPLSGSIPALAEIIARDIRAKRIAHSFARRGDVALVQGGAHQTFAVVDMSARQMVAIAPDGPRRLPLTAGLLFWAVG